MKRRGKEMISRRFSRAASTYDDHALVQRECAIALLGLLPEDFVPDRILEIGCGTGSCTALLADRFPLARITAIDFAPGMIDQATAKLAGRPGVVCLCREGETFLGANRETYDLITSNATMQWFDDLGAAGADCGRALAENGIFLASFFGPASLGELAAGLTAVFGREVPVAAARFAGREEIRRLLAGGFDRIDITETTYRRSYPSLRSLLSHISRTGTAGHHAAPLPLTRARITALDAWFAGHGGYHVSFQVFSVVARGKTDG